MSPLAAPSSQRLDKAGASSCVLASSRPGSPQPLRQFGDAPLVQDAPQSRAGVVTSFDDPRGYGAITPDGGGELFFHCTAIADGTRTIAEGTAVEFDVVAGRMGRWEASRLTPS